MRAWWTLLHRYIGLALAGFLFIAGLTGAALAWYHELDTAINADMMLAPSPSPGATPIDALVLRERLEARYPGMRVNWVDLAPEPGHAQLFYVDHDAGKDGNPFDHNEIYVDPTTGNVLGSRKWGAIGDGAVNLMPFLYELHYSLALGTVGTTILGIAALLWTLDCFVGAYLTMPARRGTGAVGGGKGRKAWPVRWWRAWKVSPGGSRYKLNVDLHRAGGLWLWGMFFILAWSSVGFNLKEIYQPVMAAFFERQNEVERLPVLAEARPVPAVSWERAREIGRQSMLVQARQDGFAIIKEKGISYDPKKGVFRYRVLSDRDLAQRWGITSVYIDAQTGQTVAASIPTGKTAGDTVDNWLYALHMAAIWGIPYQIFMTIVGIAVAMLSVTGVVIWSKKRTARAMSPQLNRRDVHRRDRPGFPEAQSGR